MFERTINLIGIDNLNKIKNLKILVIGLGGVGGYAVESLIRSGVENITIVDYDKIDITNLNRQIIALRSNINEDKTIAFKNRIININNNVNIDIINEKINSDNINILFNKEYDYVIDACDTLEVKKLLIKLCKVKKIKLITVCGMGKKLDPSKITICDIRDTSYDPIAKILRKYVKEEKISGKVICVSSNEKTINSDKVIGSMMMVPATAGILAASYVINDTLTL